MVGTSTLVGLVLEQLTYIGAYGLVGLGFVIFFLFDPALLS